LISIIFGILAAIVWGGSDFAGGLSSRQVGAVLAVFYADLIGLAALLVAIPFARESSLPVEIILTSMGAGALGSVGLIFLYHAMTIGQMSIAAPVAAMVGAVLPIVIGAFTEGLPGLLQLTGFAFALAAVWLISQENSAGRHHLERLADLRLPFLAGSCFGLYFILVHQVTQFATIWPMIMIRFGGMLFLLIILIIKRDKFSLRRSVWPFVTTNGVLDVIGNLLYVLAGQTGRMDIAVVLSSLYPGGTVILAWIFLKERLNKLQVIGIIAALVAIVLVTI
jgi:drug/metabolite transporter (DMT)-like permease